MAATTKYISVSRNAYTLAVGSVSSLSECVIAKAVLHDELRLTEKVKTYPRMQALVRCSKSVAG